MESSSHYPRLDTLTLEEKLEQRLKEEYNYNSAINAVTDIQRYFYHELKKYSSKYKRCKRINYASKIFQVLVVILGIGVSIPLVVTGIGIPEAILVGGSVIPTVGLINIIADYIFNRYRRRYGRLCLLCKTTLLEFDSLLAEAMRDHKIDEHEYAKLSAKYQFYKNNKKTLKQETKITKEGLMGVASDDKEKFIDEILAKLKSKNGGTSM